MNDVARLVLEAWEKLGPKIMADSDELAKRLARRRMAIMTRPPRAWCLAIRASDRRITPAHWVISPEHAMDLNHPAHPYEPIEHQVIIRPHALRKFCRPVRTDSWGEEVPKVARELGIHPTGLRNARHAGKFTQRFIKGLGGKRGRYPVPLIHSWTTLDPSSGRHFSRPDPLWGGLWEFLPDMIPDDFEQTVIRTPVFRRHPAGMRVPKNHVYNDEMRFLGWRWLCPACKREVRTIYFPFAAQSTLFDYLGFDPARATDCHAQNHEYTPHDVQDVPQPPMTFACWNCHRINSTSRTSQTGWNQVVTHLTRGLLYGHEVEKPTWYRPQRKNTRSRRLHGAPAIKREAVYTRLMNGWTLHQIARDLLISMASLAHHMQIIFKQERVKNRRELAAKLGWKHQQPLNQREQRSLMAIENENRVLPLLLQGLTAKEIEHQSNLTPTTVHEAIMRIYKKHGLAKREGRRALGKKFGLELPRYGHGLGQRRTKSAPTILSPSTR